MNKYSRFLSFAAILVCLTPLGGVYTLFQTFPWRYANSNYQILDQTLSSSNTRNTEQDNHGFANPSHARMPLSASFAEDSMDPVRCEADTFLNASSTYRHSYNATRMVQQQSLESRQQDYYLQQPTQHQTSDSHVDPLMFHVRNHQWYHNHHSSNHVLLLSWTISLLLGLLIPILALLYDAYLRITSKSRHQRQLQAIQKALKPFNRKVLTKSQAKETCPICLDQFAMGEGIVGCAKESSGCSHCFHQACMVQWLVQQTKQPGSILAPRGQVMEAANSTIATLRRKRKKLKAPCPCCRQPFVKIPLVR